MSCFALNCAFEIYYVRWKLCSGPSIHWVGGWMLGVYKKAETRCSTTDLTKKKPLHIKLKNQINLTQLRCHWPCVRAKLHLLLQNRLDPKLCVRHFNITSTLTHISHLPISSHLINFLLCLTAMLLCRYCHLLLLSISLFVLFLHLYFPHAPLLWFEGFGNTIPHISQFT